MSALGYSLLWFLVEPEEGAVDLVLVPKHHTAPRLRRLTETA